MNQCSDPASSLLWRPSPSTRFVSIWQRNFRVWQKLLIPSVLGNFGEPLLYLLALGYGFGKMVGHVGKLPYPIFLATGILCSSAMTSASFEAMYSAYTRLRIQQTWAAMLVTSLTVEDIIFGEIVWAASKSFINVTAIFLVSAMLGLIGGWQAILALPVVFAVGFCFAAIAMVVTAFAHSYDYFMYYFTLVLTPLLLLSGVFFPLSALPNGIVILVKLFPLVHAIELIRPLFTGRWPPNVLLHMGVLVAYATGFTYLSVGLFRKRMLS